MLSSASSSVSGSVPARRPSLPHRERCPPSPNARRWRDGPDSPHVRGGHGRDSERGEIATLVIAHQDRVARFGVDYLEHVATKNDCDIVVAKTTATSSWPTSNHYPVDDLVRGIEDTALPAKSCEEVRRTTRLSVRPGVRTRRSGRRACRGDRHLPRSCDFTSDRPEGHMPLAPPIRPLRPSCRSAAKRR
jgi:hypothetical protein